MEHIELCWGDSQAAPKLTLETSDTTLSSTRISRNSEDDNELEEPLVDPSPDREGFYKNSKNAARNNWRRKRRRIERDQKMHVTARIDESHVKMRLPRLYNRQKSRSLGVLPLGLIEYGPVFIPTEYILVTGIVKVQCKIHHVIIEGIVHSNT